MINRGHAFIVEGYNEKHAHNLGKNIVKEFLCENKTPGDNCLQCTLLDKMENPNTIYVDGYENIIKSEHIIMIKDYCSTLNVTGKELIIFIDGIENANLKAANSFLKFLEEPRDDIKFVLTTINKEKIIPTIQSRSQIINNKDEFENEETNEIINAILQNEPFKIEWATINKSELNKLLLTLTRILPANNNEEFLKEVLIIINKNTSNVNKNILFSELIYAIKNRRI